jgi:molybdopterin-guanine dinucleotide biosynthesis adapter protein
MKQNVIGITGWKNSGKTTLVEKLVAHFTSVGMKVATVKHAHHEFDIDHAGTDSFRHRKAGAREVAIVSARRWALMHELESEGEPPLAEVLARLSPCDLVIVEGYKREGHAKIEVRRSSSEPDLSPDDPSIIAIAASVPAASGRLPVFDLDDMAAICRFIVRRFDLKTDVK